MISVDLLLRSQLPSGVKGVGRKFLNQTKSFAEPSLSYKKKEENSTRESLSPYSVSCSLLTPHPRSRYSFSSAGN